MSRRSSTAIVLRLGSAIAGLIALLVVWAVTAAIVRELRPQFSIFLPSPAAVWTAGVELVRTDSFWRSFMRSNARVLAAWIIACTLSIPLGVVIAKSTRASAVLMPLMDFGRYLPVAAIVPLSILWLGVGENQKIAVLAAGTFFQSFVLVVDAVRRVPRDQLDAARTLGAKGAKLSLRVLLPAAWPAIFDACRICVGLTWSYLLVAELVAAENGLGYEIIRAQRFLKADQIFFIVAVLGLLGILYDRSLLLLRRTVVPWESPRTQTRSA